MIWTNVLDCRQFIWPSSTDQTKNMFVALANGNQKPAQADLMLHSVERTCRLFWHDQKTLQTFYRVGQSLAASHRLAF